jgi:hypothetical protein
MAHIFSDKLFVFIGKPTRCARQQVRDMLTDVGGVPEGRFSVYTHFAVAFEGAEKTKLYEKAIERDRYGQIVLLTEKQFFDALEGTAGIPEKKDPPHIPNVIVQPANNPEVLERRREKAVSDAVNRQRLANMARYGVPMPDGGRMTADLRVFDTIKRVAKFMAESAHGARED